MIRMRHWYHTLGLNVMIFVMLNCYNSLVSINEPALQKINYVEVLT